MREKRVVDRCKHASERVFGRPDEERQAERRGLGAIWSQKSEGKNWQQMRDRQRVAKGRQQIW
jgi:hypothetical protein